MTALVVPFSAAASRCGTAARVRLCAVATLNSKARLRCRGAVSRKGRGMAPPTLLTTMSSRPNALTAASARPAAASRSLRSAGTTTARRPAASISWATLASCSSLRAEMTTSAPASASATAAAAPSPRPAPVTTAARPSTRKKSPIMVLPRLPGSPDKSRTGFTSPSKTGPAPVAIDVTSLSSIRSDVPSPRNVGGAAGTFGPRGTCGGWPKRGQRAAIPSNRMRRKPSTTWPVV